MDTNSIRNDEFITMSHPKLIESSFENDKLEFSQKVILESEKKQESLIEEKDEDTIISNKEESKREQE